MSGTVVVVEANMQEAELLAASLTTTCPHYSARLAPSGHLAIGLLEELPAPPQLALISLDLPGTDSLDLLGWIRRAPRLRHVPVLMLTRTLETGLIEAAYATGADSCLLRTADPGFAGRLASACGYWIDSTARPPRDQTAGTH